MPFWATFSTASADWQRGGEGAPEQVVAEIQVGQGGALGEGGGDDTCEVVVVRVEGDECGACGVACGVAEDVRKGPSECVVGEGDDC